MIHKMLVPGDSSSKRGALLGYVRQVKRNRLKVDLVAPLRRGDGVAWNVRQQERPQDGGRVFENLAGRKDR